MTKRQTLFDPMLYNKELVDLTPVVSISEQFKKKFSLINFLFNIFIPIIIILIMVFIGKFLYQERHFTKLQNDLKDQISKEDF